MPCVCSIILTRADSIITPNVELWKIFALYVVTKPDYPSGYVWLRPQAYAGPVARVTDEFDAGVLEGFADKTKVCFGCNG